MKFIYFIGAVCAFLLSIINAHDLFLVWFAIGILLLIMTFVEWLGEY